MLREKGESLQGKRVVISGSGNVAVYAAEKAIQSGARVITLSDSSGYILDEKGIDIEYVKEIKEKKRDRISRYTERHPDALYVPDCRKIWETKCEIALPCATENELLYADAEKLVSGGCFAVSEGANMPCDEKAVKLFIEKGILFGPAKAANAGGVATSALEMAQNSMRASWDFEKVDRKLREIMSGIYRKAYSAAEEYEKKDNLLFGANIAAFRKVADTMLSQGVV
jgi:glutamate dehydrogenase (NADP+)